jgi:hypothetical protein
MLSLPRSSMTVRISCEFAAFDLSREVHCRNFALANRHVAHLRTIEVDAVANRVHPIEAGDAHSPVYIYVIVVV